MWSFFKTSQNSVGSHTLLVVEYGVEKIDNKKVKYWIVQNSYQTGWGNNGFARFNMDIQDLDGPLKNAGIVPTKLYTPSWQEKMRKCLTTRQEEATQEMDIFLVKI
jgi:hypothetical protein